MRSPVPFLLLGETRRNALAEHVRTRVERWQSHWLPERRETARVEVFEYEDRSHDLRLHDAACFRTAGGERAALLLIIPHKCVPHVAGVLGESCDSVGGTIQPGSIADQLRLEALQALVREFRTADVLEPVLERLDTAATGVLREFTSLRYVGALISLGNAQCPVVLLMSPQVVSAAVGARALPAPMERLEPRRAAVGDEMVAVEAVLGDGEVMVSELARLAVGDVIVLGQRLGEPAALAIRGGGRIAGAAPGRVGGMRAVQVKREKK
jgi:flagellar motor switch/type III secretory pathway protein FliN